MRGLSGLWRFGGRGLGLGLCLAWLGLAQPGFSDYQETQVTSGALVRGIVHWVGDIPPKESFQVNVDEFFCAPKGRKDNDRVEVDPQSRAVANAVVYLEDISKGKPWQPVLDADAFHDQLTVSNCLFQPRLALVPEAGKLRLVNRDPVLHELVITGSDSYVKRVSLSYNGQDERVALGHVGFFQITCKRHPWESASAVLAGTPYYAVTNEKGEYEIGDIPPGEYNLVVWHDGMRMEKIMRNGLVHDYHFSPALSQSEKLVLKENEAKRQDLQLKE